MLRGIDSDEFMAKRMLSSGNGSEGSLSRNHEGMDQEPGHLVLRAVGSQMATTGLAWEAWQS